MPEPALTNAFESVPTGSWAVAVSGGADSVALLVLLRRARPELPLHAVHLDHQLRGDASREDARFVEQLASRLAVPCTLATRDQIEPAAGELPANPSARYRRLRLILFEQVVRAQALDGVILAHHADDQAETVLQRLLRGSGVMGLAGMSPAARVAGLTILRPLLDVRRRQLRAFLREIDQPWRIDASNTSPLYLRNRLRGFLQGRGALVEALLELGRCSATVRDWARRTAPSLEARFAAAQLATLPSILARESAKRWLRARGASTDELIPDVVDRLITMTRDAPSPARQHFPGRLLVRRRSGTMFVDDQRAS